MWLLNLYGAAIAPDERIERKASLSWTRGLWGEVWT